MNTDVGLSELFAKTARENKMYVEQVHVHELTRKLIDFLKAARPNDAPPKLILNMVGLPKRPEIPAKDFGQAIGIEPTLTLPFDAQLFGTAANNGQMIAESDQKSPVNDSFDLIARAVTGRGEVKRQKKSALAPLFARFRGMKSA